MGLLREVELLADIAAYRQENERLHSEIERLRAEVGRLEAELLTKQRGQYVDGLFGRGGRS